MKVMTVSHYESSVHTLAYVPKWNANGEPYTEVYEMHRTVHVKKPTRTVAEDTLRFNGQTMRGARDGTIALLGKVNCPPFTVNEMHGMYMLYTGPVTDPETVYLMLHGIKDSDVDEETGGTLVTLINGEVLPLKVKFNTFKKREAIAMRLQYKRERRTELMLRYYQYCAECREDYGNLNKE